MSAGDDRATLPSGKPGPWSYMEVTYQPPSLQKFFYDTKEIWNAPEDNVLRDYVIIKQNVVWLPGNYTDASGVASNSKHGTVLHSWLPKKHCTSSQGRYRYAQLRYVEMEATAN